MPISSFALANLASIPLIGLYVVIGASAGELFQSQYEGDTNMEGLKSRKNREFQLFVLGIFLSITSIISISRLVRKELKNVLQRKSMNQMETDNSSTSKGVTLTDDLRVI